MTVTTLHNPGLQTRQVRLAVYQRTGCMATALAHGRVHAKVKRAARG